MPGERTDPNDSPRNPSDLPPLEMTDDEWAAWKRDTGIEPLADRVRSYICSEGPGDHGHTDCWHLSMAADIIDARDDYERRRR